MSARHPATKSGYTGRPPKGGTEKHDFTDGYDWVMLPNVTGMSQHADGGLMTTKPYAAGSAYINCMSDHCGSCATTPGCALRQPLLGLVRLKDLDELVVQERARGDAPP